MKYFIRLMIVLVFGIFSISFFACENSSEFAGQSPEIDTIYNEILFRGATWADVNFEHKDHSDHFSSDCFQCHNCSDVHDETNWNCRSCHSALNAESLCTVGDDYHGCAFAQCMRCHEDPNVDTSDQAPKRGDCNTCHPGGSSTQTPSSLNAGQFVDSPVEGAIYKTATRGGATDATGTFYYQTGETITFSIGGILLGKATAESVMTPLSLVSGATECTDQSVTNICRLLLSLDLDGNPDNGIQFSEAIIRETCGMSVEFNKTADDFENDPDIQSLFNTLNTNGAFQNTEVRTLISAAEAQNHLVNTLEGLNEEPADEDEEPAGENTAPTVSNVGISGNPKIGSTLTGTYTYDDAEGDAESGSTYKWYRNDVLITGATSKTYTLVSADLNMYIKFEVTPAAAAGISPGTASTSSAFGPITQVVVNTTPTATVYSGIKVEGCSGNVGGGGGQPAYLSGLGASSVDGVYQIADKIRYTVDPNNNDAPCNPKFCDPYDFVTLNNINGIYTSRVAYKHENYYNDPNDNCYWISYYTVPVCRTAWFIADSAGRSRGGGALAVGVNSPSPDGYTAPLGDWGDFCGNGVELSLYGGPNKKPGIAGDPTVGSTLTGNYDYSDAEGDTEGQSAYRWLRCDTVNGSFQAISGATGITYTLTQDDLGKFLKFEVTPVALTGASLGSPATSSYAGIGPVIP